MHAACILPFRVVLLTNRCPSKHTSSLELHTNVAKYASTFAVFVSQKKALFAAMSDKHHKL